LPDIVFDSERAMHIQVETYVDEGGAEHLRRFRLDSRVVEVADNIDQWHGAGYRYVKVRGSDGDIYILRQNETGAEWELTMYQRSQSQAAPASIDRIDGQHVASKRNFRGAHQ
jgi:hypothetical protein